MMYGPDGKPVEPTLAEVAGAFGQDLERLGKILQMLQNSIMLVEMKANFVIKHLQEKGIFPAELDTLWAEFVAAERLRFEKEDEEEIVPLASRDNNGLNLDL